MSGAGRPKLPVGEVGKISIERAGDRFIARGSTNDAGGTLRRIVRSGDTSDEASAALLARAAELGLVAVALGPTSTLGELAVRWLEDDVNTRRIEDSTKTMYSVKVNRLRRDYGAILLSDLNGTRVRAVLLHLRDNCTTAEFQVMRSTLTQVLEFAVLSDLLPYNAMKMMRSIHAPEDAPKMRALNADQAITLLDEARKYADAGRRISNRRRVFLTLAVILGVGGLRVPEALAIRQQDVDFEASTVHICGTLTSTKKKGLHRKDKRKRKGQERLVHLDPNGLAMRALRAAWDDLAPEQRRPDLPIFHRVESDGDSVWINSAIVREHLERIRERPAVVASLAETGMEPSNLTPHALRHTVATVLSDRFGREAAQEALAHEKGDTTKRYIAPKVKEYNGEQVDAAFGLQRVLI